MALDDVVEALKLVNSIWAYKLTVKKCIDTRKVKVRQAMWIRRRLVVAVIMVINVTVPSTGGATVRFGFNIGWNVKMSQRPSQPLAKVSRPLNWLSTAKHVSWGSGLCWGCSCSQSKHCNSTRTQQQPSSTSAMTARPTGIDLPKESGSCSMPTQPSVRFNLERNTVHQYIKTNDAEYIQHRAKPARSICRRSEGRLLLCALFLAFLGPLFLWH